jgi:hypothetical protein
MNSKHFDFGAFSKYDGKHKPVKTRIASIQYELRTKCDIQVCLNITSFGCIVVAGLVVGFFTSIHMCWAIDRLTPCKFRLNADSIFSVGWVVYF